jgi:hypothetical protein
MAFVSLDSPSCEVPCLILLSVVYRDVTRQAKRLYRLKHDGALKRGLAYLSWCNSSWFCHTGQPFSSYSGTWIRATTTDCRTIRTFIVWDVRLQRDCMAVLPSAMQNVFPHISAYVTKPKFEWWGKSTSRANQVIGLPRTIFTVCG